MPQKRRFKPRARKSGFRDAKLVVVACEGAKTEAAYFNGLRVAHHNPRVHVHTLPSEDNNSSPSHVFTRLREFKRSYHLQATDELWVVLDRDAWEESNLSRAAQDCVAAGFFFAVSTPCFELWLLLHVKDPGEYSEAELEEFKANRRNGSRTRLEQELIAICGAYNKTSPQLKHYLPHVHSAIARAKSLDVEPAARWPDGLGTRVYLVVESILP